MIPFFERLRHQETITNVRIGIPSLYLQSIIEAAGEKDIPPEELLVKFTKLNLLLLDLQDTGTGDVLYRQGESEVPVNLDTVDTIFQPDQIKLNPATDATALFHALQEASPKVEQSPSELQQRARQCVEQAATAIQDHFGERLTEEQMLQLSQIADGVVVVRNLDTISANLSFSDLQLPSWAQIFFKLIIDAHGLVWKPYQAIAFDEKLFATSQTPAWQQHATTHELLHVLSENHLPMLLNEAATDFYAAKVVGNIVDASNRMSANYRFVCQLWEEIVTEVGEDVAFDGYREVSTTQETIRGKRVTETRFFGHPLHQQLQKKLGKTGTGKFVWDEVLDLLEQKKGKRALYLFRSRLTK